VIPAKTTNPLALPDGRARAAVAGAYNPFNPFNIDITGGTRARLAEFGNRIFRNQTDATLITTGVKGENIAGKWNFDAGYSYSAIKDTSRNTLVSSSRFNRLLNANYTFFQPGSPDYLGTTTPYNPFGYYKVSIPNNAKIVGAALINTKDLNESKLNQVNAVISTGSLLDLVRDSTAGLAGTLGAADQARMGEYLDSVRDIERQVQKMADQDFSRLALPDAPAGVPASFDEHINLMFDLIALAYQAGLTRVVSFMMAAEISMLTYNQVGVSEAFHPLSHHQNSPEKMARLAVVQTYHSKVFARFLDKLAKTKDGDGTLLDHSILLYGSNMSDSNLHNADPLPSVVFGRGYGRLKGGQHLAFAQDTPHANLVLTLLERAGLETEKLGNSTGDLTAV